MPYGFIKHIENKGYSVETVSSYHRVIHHFFSFIRKTYPNNKEPHQISSKDIKTYMKEQINIKEKSISTVNKELAILKSFFNYLWEEDIVPVDRACKIKRYEDKEKLSSDLNYRDIIDLKHKVLTTKSYSLKRKVIFILAVEGLKISEFRFLKDDVIDDIEKNLIIIKLKNRDIKLIGQDALYFQEYYYENFFNGSEYVFITKSYSKDKAMVIEVPIQIMSVMNHLRAINKDYFTERSINLTLTTIRRAMSLHYYEEGFSIQEIANKLGIEESTTSHYLKLLTNSNK